MPAAQDLVAHPHAFIRHNLLLFAGPIEPGPAELQANGTVFVKLEDYTQYYQVSRVKNRKGIPKLINAIQGVTETKLTSFYVVTPAQPNDPNAIAIYVCPYRTNASLSTNLGTASNLMFTAEMTGCSFGVGQAAANGSVLVMHSNESQLATPTSTAPQEQGQLQQLTNANAIRKTLQPGSYRMFDPANDIDYRATTIGIRVGTKWEFWYQNFNHTTTNKDMVSVARIK